MGKSLVAYAGNEIKFGFPHHKQESPSGCGPACLRMLAEWATEQPQSEYHWQMRSDWSANAGLPSELMGPALGQIGELTCSRISAKTIEGWRGDLTTPTDVANRDVVYLLRTDSYGYDGENVGHWVILLDLFSSVDRKNKIPRHRLALYVDPLYDELSVLPWEALLASKVLDGFHITRTPRHP